MAKAQQAQGDLEKFLEYQQIMKEEGIVNNPTAKKQVLDIYKPMMNTKEGKQLLEKHHNFKTSINLSSERSFLEKNLPNLIQHTPINRNLKQQGSLNIELESRIKNEVKDHAKAMTGNTVHPYIKENPDKLTHAIGTVSRAAGMRLEKVNALQKGLDKVTSQVKNMVGNLKGEGRTQEQVMDLMKEPKQEMTKTQSPTKKQAKGIEMGD